MVRLLALSALVLLSGCATSAGIAPGQSFALAVGEQVVLPDASTLRYAGIANDSRCPPDVQCIRAGDADVLLDHAAGGAVTRITLNTERTPSTVLGPWRLQLLELAPGDAPRATFHIDANGATP
ncbi:hypothetical protein [Lysobacter terrae]